MQKEKQKASGGNAKVIDRLATAAAWRSFAVLWRAARITIRSAERPTKLSEAQK